MININSYYGIMNIFWLHRNGWMMALMHADPHVVKMILEIAQMCSNVYYHYTVSKQPAKVYKRTHARHPMSIFVCQNKQNFVLAVTRGLQIAAEYTQRFGKQHKCEDVLRSMLSCPPAFDTNAAPEYTDGTVFGSYGEFSIPLCMPEEFHDADACMAYLKYYHHKLATVPRLRRWNRQTTLALPYAIRVAQDKLRLSA